VKKAGKHGRPIRFHAKNSPCLRVQCLYFLVSALAKTIEDYVKWLRLFSALSKFHKKQQQNLKENFTHRKFLKFLNVNIKTVKKAGKYARLICFAPKVRPACAMCIVYSFRELTEPFKTKLKTFLFKQAYDWF